AAHARAPAAGPAPRLLPPAGRVRADAGGALRRRGVLLLRRRPPHSRGGSHGGQEGTGGHRIAAACTAAIDQPEKYTNRPEKPTPPVTGLLRGPASSPDIDRELITVNPASRVYATGTAPTSPEPSSGAYRAR